MRKRGDARTEGGILQEYSILEDAREIFYRNTGMTISFHYTDGEKRLDFYPLFERSAFCMHIQSTEEGLRRCVESDRNALRIARRNGGFLIYRCHAGLTDVAIPLVYRGKEIGSIYSGQVLTQPQTESSFEEAYSLVKTLGVDRTVLRDAFFKVKVIDAERLHFCVKLLSLIAHHIVAAEKQLDLQRAIIRKNRELLKKEREKLRLEKTLMDLSRSVLEYEKKSRGDPGATAEELHNDYIVSKAQLFMKTHYDKHIDLEDVAGAVYLSPNYFSVLFKKNTGCNFREYLTKIRVEAACELLAVTETPIKDIVCRVGFNDYNYFNKTFKRYVGMPPAEFRRKPNLPNR